MFTQDRRGLTIIELLVVIAIIGILASIVMVSLDSIRGKSIDTKIRANIANVRSQAEIHWNGLTRSYDSLCSDPTVLLASDGITEVGSTMNCTSATSTFLIWAPLIHATGTIFCVDNNGFSGEVSTAPTGDLCN